MTELTMHRGDDREVVITATDNLEGSIVRFTTRYRRTDAEPVFEKTTEDGSIIVAENIATVRIDAEDTDDLVPTVLRWDVEITGPSGLVQTYADGYLAIKGDVTRPTA